MPHHKIFLAVPALFILLTWYVSSFLVLPGSLAMFLLSTRSVSSFLVLHCRSCQPLFLETPMYLNIFSYPFTSTPSCLILDIMTWRCLTWWWLERQCSQFAFLSRGGSGSCVLRSASMARDRKFSMRFHRDLYIFSSILSFGFLSTTTCE